MTIYEFTEWRFRLGLSQERAAELLGVHSFTVVSWELGVLPIKKQTHLATLACELAYIAADQYIKTHPVISHNLTHKNQVEALGRRYIRDGIINGRNPVSNELSILIPPKSLIHYEDKRS